MNIDFAVSLKGVTYDNLMYTLERNKVDAVVASDLNTADYGFELYDKGAPVFCGCRSWTKDQTLVQIIGAVDTTIVPCGGTVTFQEIYDIVFNAGGAVCVIDSKGNDVACSVADANFSRFGLNNYSDRYCITQVTGSDNLGLMGSITTSVNTPPISDYNYHTLVNILRTQPHMLQSIVLSI